MALLLDVDYVAKDKTEVLFYTPSGVFRYAYNPYLLVENIKEEDIKKIKFIHHGEVVEPLKYEKLRKVLFGKPIDLFKLEFKKPSYIPKVKEFLKENFNAKCYEYDIPFKKRVVIDFQLTPLDELVMDKVPKTVEGNHELNILAFDIEVYNPRGSPDPSKDKIILISYATSNEKGVLSLKGSDKYDFVKKVPTEKLLLEEFSRVVERINPDVVVGYNSSVFDLVYMYERAKKLKANLKLGRFVDKVRKVSRGLVKGFHISGRIHVDLYPVARLLGGIGAIDVERYTLYDVYKAVVGKQKPMVNRMNIWKMWDLNELDELLYYSLMDAESTYEIAKEILPLEMELSKLAHSPLFETALSTTGQLVESLMMFNAFKRGEIIPRKPKQREIEERMANPIEGAFVKLPSPGVYEDIAVLDFRGLYPSIIVTYNVDPSTLSPEGEIESPIGARFKKKPEGLMPSILRELIEKREVMKKRLKELDKDSMEYKHLYARSQAYKILANSFYGYLGYARSRYYCRECAASVTAWGRQHIKEAASEAEKMGFHVLYIDTDSLFLLLNDKTREDAINFLDYINSRLPGIMRMDLEGFYKRAVFVSKKSERKGAKKKYALLSYDGRIKIRGFELVRRDWSQIARKTQEKVLEIILKEGSKEKAVEYVKGVISKLRNKEVPLDELVIYTQITKDIWDYETTSPEVSAAKRLSKAGRKVGPGTIIGYVITSQGTSISDKAWPVEMANDYDPEYYVNNQIIPSVMKILKELGVNEEELRIAGRQRGLGEFM